MSKWIDPRASEKREGKRKRKILAGESYAVTVHNIRGPVNWERVLPFLKRVNVEENTISLTVYCNGTRVPFIRIGMNNAFPGETITSTPLGSPSDPTTTASTPPSPTSNTTPSSTANTKETENE